MVGGHIAEKFGICHVLDCLVETRELRRGCLADVWNRKRVKPAGERESSGACNGLYSFGGVFLAENSRRFIGTKIQLGQLLDLQLEKIQRFANQTAFNQFVGDNAAHAFDIKCAAGGKEFEATRSLGGAMQIFAAPGYKLRIAGDGAAAGRTFSVNM